MRTWWPNRAPQTFLCITDPYSSQKHKHYLHRFSNGHRVSTLMEVRKKEAAKLYLQTRNEQISRGERTRLGRGTVRTERHVDHYQQRLMDTEVLLKKQSKPFYQMQLGLNAELKKNTSLLANSVKWCLEEGMGILAINTKQSEITQQMSLYIFLLIWTFNSYRLISKSIRINYVPQILHEYSYLECVTIKWVQGHKSSFHFIF